ncbi:MAG: bacterial Ig-like domain-containing protein [Micrococcales bacterium]|nr:bacterial Ig-like domain-containing protein [Micrococcales bacterium]
MEITTRLPSMIRRSLVILLGAVLAFAVISLPSAPAVAAPGVLTISVDPNGSNIRSQVLHWSAPFGDAVTSTGQAASYDVRYAGVAITEANFDSCSKADVTFAPAAQGTTETMYVNGLEPAKTYFFAAKAINELGEASPISNVPSAFTERPAGVVDEVTATSIDELQNYIYSAPPQGRVITLQAGEYTQNSIIRIEGHNNITIQGSTSDYNDTVIRGWGIDNSAIAHNVYINASSYVTIKNLTLKESYFHAVQIANGSHYFYADHVKGWDNGEAAFKISSGVWGAAGAEQVSDFGVIRNSYIGFTTAGARPVIEGIDGVGAKGWLISGNTVENVRYPSGSSSVAYGIYFKGNSIDSVLENNVIINSDIGLSFGNGSTGWQYFRYGDTRFEHQGGIMRNNVVKSTSKDTGIVLRSATGFKVYNNTVWNSPTYPYASICLRIAETGNPPGVPDPEPTQNGEIVNNILRYQIEPNWGAGGNDQIPATIVKENNLVTSDQSIFIDTSAGDFHLAATATNAIGQGANLYSDVPFDADGVERPATGPFEIGAYQLVGGVPVTLDWIGITAQPTKVTYTEGESLDLTGLEVTATYSDSSTADVTADVTTSPAAGTALNTVGSQTVTVTYVEAGVTRTTSFSVTVAAEPVVLDSIAVTASPSKTSYTAGEALDLAGLEVTATYSDGSTAVVTGSVTTTPAAGTALNLVGPLTVTVYYFESGVSKTTSFTVDVAPRPVVVTSLEVNTLPTKIDYLVGETLDLTGWVVWAHLSDGTWNNVSMLATTTPAAGAVLDTAGTQTVGVSYTMDSVTVTASFVVTVTAVPVVLDSIAVTAVPSKVSYSVGEALDLTGLEVTATYSDGSTADVTASVTTVPTSGSVFGTPGTPTITVSYTESSVTKTASFGVTVTAIFVPTLDAELVAVALNGVPYTASGATPNITAGQSFYLRIEMLNTGSATWGQETGEHGSTMFSRNPDYNDLFGAFFLSPSQGTQITPGQTQDRTWSLRAPSSPGSYTMTWQLADWIIPYASWMDYHTAPFYGEAVTITVNVVPRTDSPPPTPPRVPGVVDQFDLEYQGSFTLPMVPGYDKTYTDSGISLRTVGGEKRLIAMAGTYSFGAYEVAIPSPVKIVGSDTSGVPEAQLRSEFGPLPVDPEATHNGTLWYDQAADRLYWTNIHGYFTPGTLPFPVLRSGSLAGGTLTETGQWYQPADLGGAPLKSFWGGVTGIPQGFANQYTGGKTIGLGFGGMYSINSSASWGPSLAAAGLNTGGAMDLQPVLFGSFDKRAMRDGDYFYATEVSYQPNPVSPWEGQWTSGDFIGSGVFIDLPDKQGYVSFSRQTTGRIGYDYGGSNWNGTHQNVWYFYDYESLGKAAMGTLPKDSLTPSSLAYMDLPNDSTAATQQVTGSAFDPETRLLYVYTTGALSQAAHGSLQPAVHVYSVIEDPPEPVVLDSVAVTANPTKSAYTAGEVLDLTGLAVTATYSDGSTVVVTGSVTTSPAAGTALNTVGSQTVTVTYVEAGVTRTTSFTVTVAAVPVVLDSVAVTANPTKSAYIAGEALDLAGLAVTATYSDGSTAVVTGSVTTTPAAGTALNTVGSQTVTVTYVEAGVTRTTSFSVTVTAVPVVLDSIAVTASPSKTAYIAGEALDLTGLEVTATYSDGSTAVVTGSVTTSPAAGTALNTVGSQTVTVTYSEAGRTRVTTFTIEVAQPTDPGKTKFPAKPVVAPTDGSAFSGTAEPGTTVTVQDGSGAVLCAATVQPDGAWQCKPDKPAAEGDLIKITVTNSDGNTASRDWRVGLPKVVVVTSPILVGQTQKVEGFNFQPGEAITATMYSAPYAVGSQKAAVNGSVSWTFTIPPSTAVGQHRMELVGLDSGNVQAQFQVEGPKPTPTPLETTSPPVAKSPTANLSPTHTGPPGGSAKARGLAFTGSNLVGLLGVAIGSTLAGLALASRRRHLARHSR